MAVGVCCTLYPQKLALPLPTSGGRLVGVVCLWTKAMELVFSFSGADVQSITNPDTQQDANNKGKVYLVFPSVLF
jgi:hypothetical protein